jgi:hypothetical protein
LIVGDDSVTLIAVSTGGAGIVGSPTQASVAIPTASPVLASGDIGRNDMGWTPFRCATGLRYARNLASLAERVTDRCPAGLLRNGNSPVTGP